MELKRLGSNRVTVVHCHSVTGAIFLAGPQSESDTLSHWRASLSQTFYTGGAQCPELDG